MSRHEGQIAIEISRSKWTSKAERVLGGCAVVLFVTWSVGCAELSGLKLPIPGFPGGPLDERTVASGLREALRVGTERASDELSQPGGFSNDPLLRLVLPHEFDDVASALRSVGFGKPVDDLEVAMNRAAEAAVAEAVPVFASAITSMSIADAFAILNGEQDAATQYFRQRTSEALRARFVPIAERGMRSVGLYRIYEDIVQAYERIPFHTMPAPDLEAHVTDAALAGLFSELAEEEARIRRDPAARTTALLRRVFSR